MSKQQETFEPMTDEQVANFRRVLSGMIGPYAFLMCREQVVQTRDCLQKQANEMSDEVSNA